MIPLRLTPIAYTISLSLVAFPVAAEPDERQLITPAFVAELKQQFEVPLVRKMVNWQNQRTQTAGAKEIEELDSTWVRERESSDKSLIVATLSNPLSAYLQRFQSQSLGLYSEIFVMDARGLNVGQSAITSDYWQGDEAKFQKTFTVSPKAVFIDEREFHDPSGTWRSQVSFTLADPGGTQALGAVTVEVNLTELARRQVKGS